MTERRWRPAGVRLRTTLFATAIVGVALAIGLVALLLLARSSFETAIQNAAIARAESIGSLASRGVLGDSLPTGDDIVATQLVSRSGTVERSSANVEGIPAFSDGSLPAGERLLSRDRNLSDALERIVGYSIEGAVLVVRLGTETPDGPAEVVVVSSLNTEGTLEVLIQILAWSFPAVMVVVAVVTWWGTGRALQPVEDMRLEADLISHTDLHRRLPVPPSADEVRSLAVTMNEMLGRLEAAADEHYQFVADASHELKSPVAAIRTMIDVARSNPDLVDFDTLLEDLLHEDLRLEMLVGDLLTLARYDERGLTVHVEEVDLDEVVRSEASMVMTSSTAPIDLSEVQPIRLEADPARLQQLLRNLLDNSVRHASTGVWVETRVDGLEAVLTVSNDGEPISPEERERIFERFVRLDDARGRYEGGTGLGLPVVRAIVRAHGGRVAAIEPLHGGATFEVRLPRVVAGYPAAGRALSP
ncbi:MAG: HAMP domain-containing histidine kinase [Acidimicrobiia bacterium]|nr:HAMP domain-containing histidine kinase [Acidimicrobiia bacterium]NNF10334.1 HAMP domain-containing histidine kinase [Acidimicrobiia bacterium]NNL70913.1 HAMP domain-containing histidine kinase [Acidimicrobiia bacterium]